MIWAKPWSLCQLMKTHIPTQCESWLWYEKCLNFFLCGKPMVLGECCSVWHQLVTGESFPNLSSNWLGCAYAAGWGYCFWFRWTGCCWLKVWQNSLVCKRWPVICLGWKPVVLNYCVCVLAAVGLRQSDLKLIKITGDGSYQFYRWGKQLSGFVT